MLSAEQLTKGLKLRVSIEVGDVDEVVARARGEAAHLRTYAQMSPQGHYALLGRLGEGSTALVFAAKDHDLKRKVAFKALAGRYAEDEVVRQRFLAEVQITAQLDHPSIVPVYGLDVARDGRMGYAAKLVDGENLHDLLARVRSGKGGRWAQLERRLEVFLKVCDAVGYAHAKGVLHRDLKPANIMVGAYGETYVMDGCALVVERPHPGRLCRGHAGLHVPRAGPRKEQGPRPPLRCVQPGVAAPGDLDPHTRRAAAHQREGLARRLAGPTGGVDPCGGPLGGHRRPRHPTGTRSALPQRRSPCRRRARLPRRGAGECVSRGPDPGHHPPRNVVSVRRARAGAAGRHRRVALEPGEHGLRLVVGSAAAARAGSAHLRGSRPVRARAPHRQGGPALGATARGRGRGGEAGPAGARPASRPMPPWIHATGGW